MTYQMDLHNHYKNVRARLNAGPPVKLPAPEPEPEPEPIVEVAPEPILPLAYLKPLPEADLMRGFMGSIETRLKIHPILEKHRITWREVCAKNQKAPFVKARTEIYIALNATGWSLKQIGNLVGKRDHTTVLNSIQRFVKSYMTDAERDMCKDLEFSHVRYCYGKMSIKENEET